MTSITYLFHLTSGQSHKISLSFDPVTFDLQVPPAPMDQDTHWTQLDFHKCPHCPLAADPQAQCPFARALSGFIQNFDAYYSYEKAVVEVTTDNRTIVSRHALQEGMASILGLVGATSGCPHLNFYRPMARFHLPFASEQETLFRVFTTHLFAEYLRSMETGQPVSLDTLHERAQAVAKVNAAMAGRIRAAFKKDAVVNAIIILDTFAQAVPWIIDKGLKELRPLFR